MNAAEALASGERRLLKARPLDDLPRREIRRQAMLLLERTLGRPYEASEPVRPDAARRFEHDLERRANGEPLPYIRGYAEVAGLRFHVGPGVYPPNEHTRAADILVERAAAILARRRGPVVVDVGTGCGAIALAIKSKVPSATVFGTDIAPRAVEVARANARRLDLRARFLTSDLLAALPRSLSGRVDLVAAHVPYLAREVTRVYRRGIKAGVPRDALTDGSDSGFELIGRLAAESSRWLSPRGWLLVQTPSLISDSIAARLRRGGLVDVRRRTIRHIRPRTGGVFGLCVISGRAPARWM